MASGYDSRQPTRQTFAFQTAAPARSSVGLSGQSRGAGLIGGDSRGGAVAAGPQTDAAPIAGGLGRFVEQVMAPHVAERQREEMYKGFARAQSGMTVDELNKSGSPLAKIFGPTGFEEGAAMYMAATRVSEGNQALLQDMDTLKRLPPDEYAKVMAKRSADMMTGNPLIDRVIQQKLIEDAGPVTNTVQKARYAWLQENGAKAMADSASSSAASLQEIASVQAELDPEARDPRAVQNATGTFLQWMQKPEGMNDEVYKKTLLNFMRGAMQDGKFHAVTALRKAGVDNVFDGDEIVRLEDAANRYGQRALEQFTAGDDRWRALSDEYEMQRARAHVEGVANKWSPLDFANHLMKMNAYAKARTGVDDPVFDYADVRGEVRSLATLSATAYNRAQEKKERAAEKAADRQLKADEDAQEYAAAGAAWASGDISEAVAAGIPDRHFDRLALANLRTGNFDALAKAFRVSHFVSPLVKNDVLAEVEGALDQQYGKGMQQAHARWAAMRKANPGMTIATYGEWDAKMMVFHTLSPKLGNEAAYTRAFGDSARYSSAALPAGQSASASKAIEAWANSQQPSRVNLFAKRISRSGLAVLKNALTRRVAMSAQNSDVPLDVVIPDFGQAILADGSLQTAGGEFWQDAVGSKPFRARLGVQQDEADRAWGLVGERLKQAGLKAGGGADLEISYVHTPKGEDAVHVIGRSNGESRSVIVGIPDFKAYLGNLRKADTAKTREAATNRAVAQQATNAGLDPYRRIKGETGLQRTIRINREVATGSSPLRR